MVWLMVLVIEAYSFRSIYVAPFLYYELSSASLRNWNDGMLEYWNIGMAPFGQINACGGDAGDPWNLRIPAAIIG
jgi:hypothetical protein